MTAEKFDRWRPVPRLLCALYAALTWFVVQWFAGLDAPSPEQAAFATGTVAASAAWFKFYVNSGNGRRGDE
jgi:hypothetical protein